MDYRRIYSELIASAQDRPKTVRKGFELHHIVPKCLGGPDTKDNLVSLTYREHLVAHKLLVRMYPDEPKLWVALSMMYSTQPGTRPRWSELRTREHARLRDSAATAASTLQKALWADPERRAAMNAVHASDAYRSQMSVNAKAAWSNSTSRAILVSSITARAADPVWRARQSENAKVQWADPALRARQADKYSQHWVLTHRSGHTVHVHNMTQWAREHGFKASCLYRLAKGLRPSSYGYTQCRRATPEEISTYLTQQAA